MPSDAEEFLYDGIRSEKLGVLDRALDDFLTAASLAGEDADLLSQALTGQSHVHRARSEWDAGLAAARQSQQVALAARLPVRYAEAIVAEGALYLARGSLDEALALFGKALEAADDARMRGIALQNIGAVRAQQGLLEEAEEAFADSAHRFKEARFPRGEAIALGNRARAALDRGDRERAVPMLEQTIRLAREAEHGELMAVAQLNLAEAILTVSPERADEMACTALGHFQMNGNRARQVDCLRLLSAINAHLGQTADAERCLLRGLAIAREIGALRQIEILEAALRQLGGERTETAARR